MKFSFKRIYHYFSIYFIIVFTYLKGWNNFTHFQSKANFYGGIIPLIKFLLHKNFQGEYYSNRDYFYLYGILLNLNVYINILW